MKGVAVQDTIGRRFGVEELKGDENQNDIDEEGGGMTQRDSSMNESAAQPQRLLMSGRRPAKSVDRTARGAPLPSHASIDSEGTP